MSLTITRRTLLGQSGLASVGSLLPSCASAPGSAAPSPPTTEAGPKTYEPRPLPFEAGSLTGLSEKLIRSHHDNNYVGAVKKLVDVRKRLQDVPGDTPGYALHGLRQAELAFKNSVSLHELYFQGMIGGGSKGTVAPAFLSEHYGSAAAWEEKFRAVAKGLGGGSGWVILGLDLAEQIPRIYSTSEHSQGVWGGLPLLVLDMYEHSYHMDYGTAAAKYIDAYFANVHWELVDQRIEGIRRVAGGG